MSGLKDVCRKNVTAPLGGGGGGVGVGVIITVCLKYSDCPISIKNNYVFVDNH